MSIAIDTTPDVELIEALDFDAVLACEARRPVCEQRAAWLGRCPGCYRSYLFCAPCRRHFEDYCEGVIRAIGDVLLACERCGRESTSFADAVEWLPVKGGN